jgi:AcrR family transcriptional regulator
MPEMGSLRRQPKQSRSQHRVNAILDAAERIFSEVGFKAATTNAIARRANTNIASLYQYFPNKKAILQAVVRRYREEYDAVADGIFGVKNDSLSLAELVERFCIATVELHIRHGVVRPFFVGVGETASEFGPIELEVYGGVLQRADRDIALRMPMLTDAQRQLTLKVIMRTMQAVVALADVPAGVNKQSVIDAVKTMVKAYLDSLAAGGEEKGFVREQPPGDEWR